MQLIVLGLNHKTAPVEVRERFNFSAERTEAILRRLRASEFLSEAVLLSTCNRTEIYLVLEKPEDGLSFIRHLLKHIAGDHYNQEHFYNLTGVNCVKHLFRVVSSLDSLVIGEGQILSQIKNAYSIARRQGMTCTFLNTLFHRAIAVGKRVRTETRIAYNSVSVSSAAVDLAIKTVGDLTTANVLIIGAGHMGELTARHLCDKGAKNIFVANRDPLKAAALATKYQGIPIDFKAFWASAAQADIIITSTGATHYIITQKGMEKILPMRKNRPLILIDIAVPRDVAPEVGQMEGVFLYNIDDLEDVVDTNKAMRAIEAETAEQIIEEEVQGLKERLRYLSMRPVMLRLGDKMDLMRQRVLKHAFVKMPELTHDQRHIIDLMTQRLTHKFLREPMTAMNAVAGTCDEERYRKMISELFLLDNNKGDDLGNEKEYDYWN
ncbi:Glutamyl-tRNA reductase [bioreactor metagenome]|jgi:glutamyl-tRNA reductase|uniref:glutamyl-tRNA reductase n=1 Tax=bioreactor metagenome TaxID=1076179 RepID=A0A644UCL7_9ZZZZ|nr:glutamyl-tRNA reductase [Acidaminococcaceae bacterium]NLU44597.1 glutamyl-tRNA reductase [Acholeplasmataceae bacterium]